MGKFQAKLFTLLLFVPIVLGIFGSCDKTPPKTGTLMDFVPQNTSMVFKISDFENLQADIENNSLLSKFEKTTPYLFFSENKILLKNLHPTSQSLFCINTINDSVSAYTFISKQTKNLFLPDSLKNKTIETLKLDDQSFQRITIDKQIAYSAIIDSVFVVSSSQQILLDILKGKTERGDTFKKVFNLPSSNEFTALIRGNKVAINDSTKVAFTSWSALDVAITPESFTATGITLATDSIPQLLNVFENQIPQQNDVSALVPTDALGAVSFTFNDAEKFQKNLRVFRGEKEAVQTTGIFGSVSEAGSIQFNNETAIFIKSIDAALTNDALARFVSAKSEFREIEISTFSEPELFQKTFSPFINSKKANYVFQVENFFVFTETEITAQQIISDFQINNTLKNTSYFKNTATDLSTASSLLIFKLQGDFSESISGFFNAKSGDAIKNISFEEFPLAALQFSFDRNFAHVTLSCKEAGGSSKSVSGTVSEKFNLKLDNAVLGNPQIFDNQNNGSNVVVQDVANKLYFISESGKILWTKNLGAPILGTIESVNISGNRHLAFATKDAFYLFDRNGKEAKGFPIKFKDNVTQPLSVFDYDNNFNYRFVIVQGKDVLMYDKTGKTVKGFGFNKAKSNIVQSPVHIRMGNKDYIVIAEESGKLNILSRVGKSRISVSKNFNFSEIPIAEEDNTFVVITKENTKERISQEGKISSQKLDVGSNYWFAINGNVKVTLDDNLLRINGKLTELPLGLYSKPYIFSINRNNYITITETQEKKVYVFDKNGDLLNGFPIYGTSAAGLGEGNGKNAKNIVVKGDVDRVILYSSN
ncbi:hypothetical protein A7A78_14115 [Aequorivita soesokkakensis]|uniref:Uncharacterized protein n=1 Tax=Aequorivita soesokkakensis TaxID=1385699 RepID=A0A1A9LC41_9FLAO|nr:hypothetical protein [Aequorivita soesokkakensis]OAD90840.1 hypothetical protein A7A78_14115 [Aequorivita soesokkakensis]